MTMPPFGPLQQLQQRRSLGDQVYYAIREQIVTLQMLPGSMMYENELAEALQVSRTPIREAIRLLVSEQLLEVLPQRGTRIARISVRKVSEARFIREQLELGAFRLAASLWDPQRHAGVQAAAGQLIAEQREAAAAQDAVRFLQLDEAFHQRIIEVTGNTTLLQVIYQMRGHLNRLRCLAMREFATMDRVVKEHEALLEAVAQGRADQTGILMEQHLGSLEHEIPQLRSKLPDFFTD
ncbi:GntR family transcriptional regulator [Paenibacillus tarimensis]|uniref:GntR family transcriptional regulator n=1 Tax=Paenibacillus tarimensis TaxID=416012 RepID=UPI001F3D7393|nr:GntR family transcriptional regulator [Paenibacillus tarimensis]MCF2945753.1 GntR family transcriptional regulator [Paenibacillus tarimensis]